MKKKYLYLLLRVLVYLLVLGAVLYGLYESPYNPHPHSAEDIRRWVVGFGVWAPLIYVAVYTIRPLLLFPTLLLNLSAGVLFGPWWGILFLLLGGFGCASFCYLLGRFGGGSWLLRNFGGSWGERLTNYLVGSGSFKKMIILRTVPIFPYDPVSIIAGSVRLPFKIYAAATVLGMLPGAIAYNFLADAFGTPRFYAALAVTLLALKLLLSREGLEKMLQLDFMQQAMRPDSYKKRRLVSTYYDTADMTLTQHGIAYRVRDKGDGSFEATVKTSRQSKDGLSERLELNLPLAEAKPELNGFAALGLGYELSELTPAGVRALFTVDVERITYILDYAGAVIELAIDKGAIHCGEKSDSIDEVEFELMSGTVDALLELKERIASQVELRAEERSKFARGLALLQAK